MKSEFLFGSQRPEFDLDLSPAQWRYSDWLDQARCSAVEMSRKPIWKGQTVPTTGNILDHRTAALQYFLGTNGCHEWAGYAHDLADVMGGELGPWYEWCQQKGVIVPAEMRRYLGERRHQYYDAESFAATPQFADEAFAPTPFNHKPKVVEMTRALYLMQQQKERGKRVVVTLGDFDVGTPGHVKILDDMKSLSQDSGFTVVMVGDDSGVVLRKGEGRPYYTLQERIEWLSQQGVGCIVPVRSGGIDSVEELTDHYNNLHAQMGGAAHMRFAGDLDPVWESAYRDQCAESGVLLVKSEIPRVSQARDYVGMGRYQRPKPRRNNTR